MLVDRFKDILKATINDQIDKNPLFENLFKNEDGFDAEWKKYYDEIKNSTYSYKEESSYQGYSGQQQSYQQQPQKKTKEQEYYSALEVKPGDDFPTIKKSYRKLVKLYHPDLYAGDKKKQEMAQKVTLEINEAYNFFEKTLK
ncbi:J domain-containing protein [Flammeovirga kamogawensis]|uniref:J domain-containing protein n=1 Tax=Flammeovirga kamogawensis TaxID=373891 RepID=A0ABX8GYL0_9BACT|nr:J domain-containing protein [Flammeovirga kamogawensis]MBB6459133.1 DnaJ-domain-containing protein 1 [Flammeovirga kamogawensis]QWG08701.1 J domain-containing protein [Flammeovirga kamogawensis]TRX66994.1 J domain-containing protein [Flammeovirga kamogawensis]